MTEKLTPNVFLYEKPNYCCCFMGFFCIFTKADLKSEVDIIYFKHKLKGLV